MSRNLQRICLFAWICSVLLAGLAHSGTNSWTFTGPYGGPVASAVFHPTEPDTSLIGSARGVHLSLTQGAFWARMFPGDINDISTLVFDPSTPERVYALGNGLYRSDDARQFGPNLGPVPNLVSLAIARDGVLYVAEQWGRVFRSTSAGAQWTEIPTRPWGSAIPVAGIAVDPSNSNVLYVCFGGAGVYKSTNAGQTWSGPPIPGSPGSRGVVDTAMHIAIHPADGARILAATPNGIMRSTNGGATWSTDLSDTGFVWVGFDPLEPNSAIAISHTGQLVRSTDRGDTWPLILRPPRLPVHEAYEVALSPTTPGRMLVATSEGPMFSDDGGATFERRITNFTTGRPVALSAADDGSIYAALQFPAGIFGRSGPAWYPVNNAPLLDPAPNSPSFQSVAVAAQNSSVVYAIDLGRRFMRSIDAGQNWVGPHPQFISSPNVLTGLAVDPTNPMVVYLGDSGVGLWRSADGGATWQSRSTGLPAFNGRITISPTNSSVIYAVGLATPTSSAVYRSTDAGLNWTITAPLPSDEIRSLTVDPANPQTVYAVHSLGLSRSTNGGTSWNDITFGLPAGSYFIGAKLVVDPVFPNTLIATSSQFDRGFLRSVDGGATWETTALDLGGVRTPLGEIVLNPQRPGLLVGGVDYGGMVEYDISPDLGLTITGLDSRLAAGGTAAASIIVRNHGPHAASPSHVSMVVPDFLTLTVPAGCALVTQRLECNLPALQVNASRTINVSISVASIPASGFVTATLTGHEPDSAGGNNVASAGALSEFQSNLAVGLPAGPTIDFGATASLVATVTNLGPHASPITHLEVAVPAALAGQTATPSQGTCIGNGSVATTFKCELGVVNSGASATVSVTMRGDLQGTHTVTASITGTNTDPVSANDSSSTTSTVREPPPQRGSGGPQDGPSGGGGGGGGSFDWLALMLLSVALACRLAGRLSSRR